MPDILECIGGIYNYEELEQLLDCEIYDEDRSGKTYNPNKVGIFFYHGRHPPIVDAPIRVRTITKIIKTERMLEDGERDIHTINPLVSYINEYDQVLAQMDIKGNLIFCDFQHRGNKFYEFWNIINDWLEIRRNGMINLIASEILNEMINSLKDYHPLKVYEIKCEFDKQKFVEEVEQKIMEAQRKLEGIYKIKEEQLMEMIEEMRERLKREKEDGIRLGMKIISEISKEFSVSVEDNCLVVKTEIKPNKVKYENRIMDIPEENNEFFVKNLYIELQPYIIRVWAKKAFHPNIEETTTKVCVGDLEGQELNLENVKKLIEMLKVMNFDSAFPNRATSRLYEILKEIKKDEEEGDENVWQNDE
jgi:hypothetical protein